MIHTTLPRNIYSNFLFFLQECKVKYVIFSTKHTFFYVRFDVRTQSVQRVP